jgi:hypothetical protein
MATDSKEIVRVFRSYKKENGWPMAHEAANLIEKLEKEVADLKIGIEVLCKQLGEANHNHLAYLVDQLK